MLTAATPARQLGLSAAKRARAAQLAGARWPYTLPSQCTYYVAMDQGKSSVRSPAPSAAHHAITGVRMLEKEVFVQYGAQGFERALKTPAQWREVCTCRGARPLCWRSDHVHDA